MLPPNITLPTPRGIHSRKLHASETPAENQFFGVTILNFGPARTWGVRQNPPPKLPKSDSSTLKDHSQTVTPSQGEPPASFASFDLS